MKKQELKVKKNNNEEEIKKKKKLASKNLINEDGTLAEFGLK